MAAGHSHLRLVGSRTRDDPPALLRPRGLPPGAWRGWRDGFPGEAPDRSAACAENILGDPPDSARRVSDGARTSSSPAGAADRATMPTIRWTPEASGCPARSRPSQSAARVCPAALVPNSRPVARFGGVESRWPAAPPRRTWRAGSVLRPVLHPRLLTGARGPSRSEGRIRSHGHSGAVPSVRHCRNRRSAAPDRPRPDDPAGPARAG